MPISRMPLHTLSAELPSVKPLLGTTQARMARLGNAFRTISLVSSPASESALRRKA